MAEELAPLAPCYADKRGGHDLSYFIAEDAGTVTQSCDRCGVTRRFPVEGHLEEIPLDDLTLEEIGHLFGGKSETR